MQIKMGGIKMFKKCICVLMVVVLSLILFVPCEAMKADESGGTIKYENEDDKKDKNEDDKKDENEDDIFIEDDIDDISVPGLIFAGHFNVALTRGYYSVKWDRKTEVSNVSVPSDIGVYYVVRIKEEGFKDCTSLKSIVFDSPWDDFSIEDSAFEGCTNLTSVSFSASEKSISIGKMHLMVVQA